MKTPFAQPRRSAAAMSDLRWVLVITLLTFALSSAFELQELLASLSVRYETWQVDELPLTLTSLSFGLAWYAWRRRSESARLLGHNRELAQQLIAMQENERRALARELHDELAQHCTAIRIEAAYIQHEHDATRIAAAARRTATAAEVLCESIRGMLRRLRPAELDELGLIAALDSLCAANMSRSGTPCTFVCDTSPGVFGESMDTAIYRVSQEAIANAMRHGRPSRVDVSLHRRGDELALTIEDDGAGFDVSTRTRGLGLLGATERAAALGGELVVRSTLDAGTSVCLRLPLPRTAQAALRAEGLA